MPFADHPVTQLLAFGTRAMNVLNIREVFAHPLKSKNIATCVFTRDE